MKKIVRLSESDINRIVKKVISVNEQTINTSNKKIGNKFNMAAGIFLLENESASRVKKILNILPENTKFLSIINCEYADFSDVDICGFEELLVVNLRDTQNNFEDVVNCEYRDTGDSFYFFG